MWCCVLLLVVCVARSFLVKERPAVALGVTIQNCPAWGCATRDACGQGRPITQRARCCLVGFELGCWCLGVKFFSYEGGPFGTRTALDALFQRARSNGSAHVPFGRDLGRILLQDTADQQSLVLVRS